VQVLQEAPHRRVLRVGDTVRRPMYPWSPAVHLLLRHLAAVGFPYSPRVLGIDDEGREVLSFIPGSSGQLGWAEVVEDKGLEAFARLLREYHEAVATFRPSPETVWAFGPAACRAGEVVCHGDFGPWNVVWRDGEPVGILDWDFARPGRPERDVVYAAEYIAPFRDDAHCRRWLHHPFPPDRRHRLERFCAAYGMPSADGMVDAVLRGQQEHRELVRQLAARGLQPQASWVAEGNLRMRDGFVAWSRANRHLFE
jgi:hypothetical protein